MVALSFCLECKEPFFKGDDDSPGPSRRWGFPKMVSRDPYYSHIFRDSKMGVGLGNSMGPAYHKGGPIISWGSLEFPLTFSSFFFGFLEGDEKL